MPQLLAIAPYPNRSADTRYRISQFIPGLEQAGWQVTVRPFMDEGLFSIYNAPGHTIEKVRRTLGRTFSRLVDCAQAGKYDAIWLHKEAFMFGPPLLEAFLQSAQPNVIYDMDDAFWTHPPQIRQIGRVLRDPNRIGKILRLSKHVLAGNDFLAAYARQFNDHVTVFPTVIDTERYCFREEYPDDEIIIGWVGRWSSSPYLETLIPVIERLCARYSNVRLRFVGAGEMNIPGYARYETVEWSLERELEDIAAFDIGIMPLPDDLYSQGKCGFKLLQYMALGIPAVASPVGVNQKIVQDGINGFLATCETEWVEKLSQLIDSRNLRQQLGAAARNTVVERYSLQKAVPILLEKLGDLDE